ncbi:MAG: GNAT family N-acetyltransferase [Bacteroidota bacterium]
MEVKTLEEIETKQLLEVFNAAFSDYFVPFQLTEAQLIAKMKADKVDLSLSVGAFDDNTLVAFVLHGFDVIDHKMQVYNAGTGVIPEKRGNGLTQKLYRFVLPLLRHKGIDSIVLEVIDKNVQAIKSYSKIGFVARRKLVCYKGDHRIQKTNQDIRIKELQYIPWAPLESFWDLQPTWQNSKHVLKAMLQDYIALGAYSKAQLTGYIIFNPLTKRIQQIAVDKDFRRMGIASTLVAEVTKKYGKTLSVINVDKAFEGTNQFFNALGFENYVEQLEMVLNIN